MFGSRKNEFSGRLDNLISKIDGLVAQSSDTINQLKEENKILAKEIAEVKSNCSLLEINVEKRLVQFHKEITDKYFQTLQDIFRVNKEISLIDNLAKSIDDKEFSKLKVSLMQPLLETRWKEMKDAASQQADSKVKTIGEILVEKKEELHQKYLVFNREKKDTQFIEGQINILNLILGESKDEKKV